MLRLAIGPEMPLPSWNWVGQSLASELSKYFHVQTFRNTIPSSDLLIFVKFLPQQFSPSPGTKVIYLPIDRYWTPDAILPDVPLLSQCAAIGCHAEPLIPYFLPYCKNVFFIDHHTKYTLPSPAPFKQDGPVLWIGAFENVPYLLKWLELHPLDAPLLLLSNPQDQRCRNWCFTLAQQLSVPIQLSGTRLNGHPLHIWTEQRQHDFMKLAKAAIDIKGGPWLGSPCWSQQTKPPTKGQKYVTSGIPFAVNQDSYTYFYFQKRGLLLASPDDSVRWLSQDYWHETSRFAATLRPSLALETIGQSLRSIIQNLIL